MAPYTYILFNGYADLLTLFILLLQGYGAGGYGNVSKLFYLQLTRTLQTYYDKINNTEIYTLFTT